MRPFRMTILSASRFHYARAILLAILVLCVGGKALAQTPFATGWTLVPASSKLNFQTVKSQTIVESSRFATFHGEIDKNGVATVTIALESVDTGIDLRNVRMRFLFFETFKFPEATVTVRLDPAALAQLPVMRRMPVKLKYDLNLHGVTKQMESEVIVTMLTDSLISVASGTPISVAAADFGLSDGVKKLEDANMVEIIPSGSVTFDFTFQKNDATTPPPAQVAARPGSAAVETAGDLDTEACAGRFEIISRTGAIYFAPGSSELALESRPLLDSVVQIARRCPHLRILVSGHTDSTGVAAANRLLSEARAKSVVDYLGRNGVPPARLEAAGFGDTRPVAPNDSVWNKSRNRRIEFSIIS